ncbi:MAG: hypothetical protein OEZ22_05465 [Spirochaetia bacterium]|nr:hypothetical protein [Spirochaetia bacterium]
MSNKINQKCDFPVIKAYLSGKDKSKALNHIGECVLCLEKITHLQNALKEKKINNILNTSEKQSLPDEKIYALAEAFHEDLNSVSKKYSKESDILWQDNISLELFQIFLTILNPKFEEKQKKVPEYLKQIIANRLENESKESSKKTSDKFIIKIKDGLQLISGMAENLFLLPERADAASFRSAAHAEQENYPTSLNFFTKDENNEILLYQAVQDGPGTVMLTIKLQNFAKIPKIINLKKENRILHSYALKEEHAFFPHIIPGDYEVELKDNSGALLKKIDISVI